MKHRPILVKSTGLVYHFGKTAALDGISLELPSGCLTGLIGPDGVGKSTLLSLISGARALQQGELFCLGGDMREKAHRDLCCPNIAYMPQGLGKNLYFTLTVEENLQYFARLFGHDHAECRRGGCSGTQTDSRDVSAARHVTGLQLLASFLQN